MSDQNLIYLSLFAPLAIGIIISLVNSTGVNDCTEKFEAWVRKKQKRLSGRRNKFTRFVLNPILWMSVKFSDWTDGFAHRGIKNGVRIAATLYIIAAWLYILYIALMVVIMLIIAVAIIYVAFKFLINSDPDVRRGYDMVAGSSGSGNQVSKANITGMVGAKGKNIYSGTNWFNEELQGRVDKNGNIYKGTNWLSEEKIGRIDEQGNIFRGTNWLNEEKVGRIDGDGNILKGTNWFNEEKTGRIDEQGNVYKGTNWLNEEQTGRTGE